MCTPASMIVTKAKVFWSEKTDSHHEIISEFGIMETDARGDINIVPVEIYPEDGNLNTPIGKWKFTIDHAGYERDLPTWWDGEKYEKEVRAAVKDWKKQKVITRKRKEIKDGQFYLCDVADVQVAKNCELVINNSNVTALDNSNVTAFGNSTVKAFGNSTVKAFGNSNVMALDNSTVKAFGDSTVTAQDNSTVLEINHSATVIAYKTLDLKCLKSSKAVIIDRSGDKVVCRIGK